MFLDLTRGVYYKSSNDVLYKVKFIDLENNKVVTVDGSEFKFTEFNLCNVIE